MRLGIIGKSLSHSFSKEYFEKKFRDLGLKDHSYEQFEIEQIADLKTLLLKNPDLQGLNVTIPYKETVIPFLNELDPEAREIGAVNCITISKKKKLKGYNTDYHGFKKSIQPLLKEHHKKALILGTGGASKAIAYALRKLKIEYDFVSRTADEFQYKYEELDASIFEEYTIIINTTPVGTHPNVDDCPNLDYSLFTKKHIAYDLIYNPEETAFLKKAKTQGTVTKNGYEMLVLQAEKAWKIWNE